MEKRLFVTISFNEKEMKSLEDQMERDNFKQKATYVKWALLNHLRKAARREVFSKKGVSNV